MFNSLEKIRLLGDPVLKTQCGDIVEFDKSIENLAAKMLKVLKRIPAVLVLPRIRLE